jgi:hypothetical protein
VVLLLGAVPPAGAAAVARAPVLVEMFTSEASAASQPADSLLAKLDSEAIVLSEHVSTLDGGLWRDRLANEETTKRQLAYADRFRLEKTFVPQIVVNGAVQFIASDAQRAEQEIAKATKRVKVTPRLLWADRGVQVEIDGAKVGDHVYLALADDGVSTMVTGGENKGRQLHHIAVCREIRNGGVVPLGGAYYQLIEVPPQARRQRVVVWVQTGEVGVVSGAAMLPPADDQ